MRVRVRVRVCPPLFELLLLVLQVVVVLGRREPVPLDALANPEAQALDGLCLLREPLLQLLVLALPDGLLVLQLLEVARAKFERVVYW